MSCIFNTSNTNPRISGRVGNNIDLNITFYRNGIPADPFNIRKVSIYKSSVSEENLITVIPISEPGTSYPLPLSREYNGSSIKPGVFHLYWDVPKSGIAVPDIFFDVWHFFPDDVPIGTDTDDTDEHHHSEHEHHHEQHVYFPERHHDSDDAADKCCQKFWLYPDGFYCDSGLENIRLGFEAIDSKFYQPEIRTLEVGMMPLPLYDFDYNKIAPLIPQLRGKFTLMTDNCEILIDSEPMSIGLRQGTYRSNPFVLQYRFDTSRVLKGSYRYSVCVAMPNGESRVSPNFNIQVS